MYSVSQFQSVRICQIILTADMPLLWIFEFPVFPLIFCGSLGVGAVSSFFMAVLRIADFPIHFWCLMLCWFLLLFFLWSMINTTGMPNGLYIHWKLIIENLYSTSLFSVGETWRVIKQVQVSELNISTCRRGIKSAFKTHWHISGSAIKRCALLGLNALSQG